MTDKTTEALKLAEKMAKRHGVRMCDENGDTHGEELYCVGIEDIADIIREALAEQEKQEPVVRATLAPPAPPEVYQMRSKDAYEAGWWEAQRQKAVSPIAPAQQAEQEPGFYGRAAARLSQRVKELELEQSGKWRDHVEHRMLTWKTSHMNESGDQLSLKDFMDEHILDDLIDFVCDEYTARTKDLTDEELREIMKQPFNQREYLEQFARAVIAAFKEKNK